jgi:predicted O-methyltransferase YrrM
MRKRTSPVVVREVLGKKLYCLPDQSGPDLDIAAVEKRCCNHLIAKYCKFERALDAFAGVGVSARYWSSCARELFLVERRPAAVELLRKNLPSIERRGCKVRLIVGSAKSFLEDALRSGWKFELVDCDPFGTCYELLPMVTRLVPRGVVCVTSGEIFQVYRGLNRRPGRPSAEGFRGRRVSRWVTQILIPELIQVCGGAELIHFYAYPTSVRVILALGGFPVPVEVFSQRARFLGWLGSQGDMTAAKERALGSLQTVD